MNPHLSQLQPYPFEKLRTLFSGVKPNLSQPHINMGIGEPRHATPPFIKEAISRHLDGLASYPATKGTDELRQAIARWLKHRYHIPQPDSQTQILPTLGSREALFSLAQAILDPLEHSWVICPNPFYQIYEGAALLGGARPYFVNANPVCRFHCDYDSVPVSVWEKARLLYLCSPANPTGAVLGLPEWKKLFDLSDQYNFIIISDECYSEIYFENNAPLGGMQAASLLGRPDYRNLVVLSSLSKRSNVPGMRSGFAAGDAAIIEKFLLYRTYHGSAMGLAIQHASTAAWNDENHVIENRRKYQEKFRAITPLLQEVLNIDWPDASFYLWAEVHEKTGLTDTEFARRLYEDSHVTVLPGSYLAREAHGVNPGANRIRIALVAEYEECLKAVSRITDFIRRL